MNHSNHRILYRFNNFSFETPSKNYSVSKFSMKIIHTSGLLIDSLIDIYKAG